MLWMSDPKLGPSSKGYPQHVTLCVQLCWLETKIVWLASTVQSNSAPSLDIRKMAEAPAHPGLLKFSMHRTSGNNERISWRRQQSLTTRGHMLG
mmetsp:Transcript_505/g.1210  ORF Transcript_505/g.1210 Transcript_505/m.1210 type:complete len:94 (+) Transcript_505:159-440(+)